MMRRSIGEVLREVPPGSDPALYAGGAGLGGGLYGGRQPTLEAQIDEAFARGFEEGRLEAQRQAEAALAESAAKQHELVEAEATKWRDVVARDVITRLDAQLAAFKTQVSHEASEVLKGLLQGTETEHAIADLVRELGEILDDQDLARCVVSGPPALLYRFQHQLRAHLEGSGRPLPNVEAIESETIDLSIVVNDVLLETRLADWADRVQEVTAA